MKVKYKLGWKLPSSKRTNKAWSLMRESAEGLKK